VFHAQCDGQGKELKTLRPKAEAVQLRVIVQDRLTGALGSVHVPLSKLKK
jgi:hypothetical protein